MILDRCFFRPELGAPPRTVRARPAKGPGTQGDTRPLLLPGEVVHNEAICRTWVSPSG